jgi:hypothetical protein
MSCLAWSCIHIYIYTYLYIYIYIYVYIYTHTHTCICMYLYVQVGVGVSILSTMNVHVMSHDIYLPYMGPAIHLPYTCHIWQVCVCIYIYIYTHTHIQTVYIYTHIRIHTYTYKHTHIHTRTHLPISARSGICSPPITHTHIHTYTPPNQCRVRYRLAAAFRHTINPFVCMCPFLLAPSVFVAFEKIKESDVAVFVTAQ